MFDHNNLSFPGYLPECQNLFPDATACAAYGEAIRSLLSMAGSLRSPTYAALYSGEWAYPTCSGHGR